MDTTAQVEGLRKPNHATTAVDEILYEVNESAIFRMVSLNGFDKTTNIERTEGHTIVTPSDQIPD